MLFRSEMVARDEVRLRPLQQLRRTILASLESGELDRSTFDRIQELDDQARTGNGLVASQTEYLYTPDSTVNVVAGLVENRGQLEYKAQDYVNEDPSNQDNLSDGFFNGIKGINEATHTLDEMGEKLGRLYVHDNHLKESFYALRQKLTHLPLSYDEGMLNSLLHTVNEVIADAEDSDRSRDGVHKVAAELRKIADKLLDSSAQVSRSRE